MAIDNFDYDFGDDCDNLDLGDNAIVLLPSEEYKKLIKLPTDSKGLLITSMINSGTLDYDGIIGIVNLLQTDPNDSSFKKNFKRLETILMTNIAELDFIEFSKTKNAKSECGFLGQYLNHFSYRHLQLVGNKMKLYQFFDGEKEIIDNPIIPEDAQLERLINRKREQYKIHFELTGLDFL